jgi:hypothetical protein
MYLSHDATHSFNNGAMSQTVDRHLSQASS